LLGLVAEELNVKQVRFAESADGFGRWHAKPNYKVLGPRLGPRVKVVATALDADDGPLADALASGRAVTVDLPEGPPVDLAPDDVDLVQETLEGWGVVSEGGLTVALELEITPELRREGLARDLVRAIQDARKAAGLQVSDRIELGVTASGEVADALRAHRNDVIGETLAVRLEEAPVADEAYREEADIEGTPVTITLRRA
jgi:isoleucyl-tRNA synthetase